MKAIVNNKACPSHHDTRASQRAICCNGDNRWCDLANHIWKIHAALITRIIGMDVKYSTYIKNTYGMIDFCILFILNACYFLVFLMFLVFLAKLLLILRRARYHSFQRRQTCSKFRQLSALLINIHIIKRHRLGDDRRIQSSPQYFCLCIQYFSFIVAGRNTSIHPIPIPYKPFLTCGLQ